MTPVHVWANLMNLRRLWGRFPNLPLKAAAGLETCPTTPLLPITERLHAKLCLL